MLLTIDVGNTNMVFGIYQEKKLLGSFRLSTNSTATSDEIGIMAVAYFERFGYQPHQVTACMIGSVVPQVMYSLTSAIIKYFGVAPLVVGTDVDAGLEFDPRCYETGRLGTDRALNCIAAIEKYGPPFLILDFGTATTIDAVDEKGVYLGGTIGPGLQVSLDALVSRTAMLPRVELQMPDTVLGRNTVEQIQAGVVTGYVGADGTTHGLAVYLPAGYDENRIEPYKVLYISHGTGGDLYGEEMRWFNEGAVCNINDNLGLDFVVVGMNNQEFAISGAGQPDWDFEKIAEDQIDYIMPFVEEHFNVSAEPAGRAYAGLSMGGATTSNFLMHHGDLFDTFGIWSYANIDSQQYCNVPGLEDEEVQARVAALEGKNIMIAYGSWDFGMGPCKAFAEKLGELDVAYTELEVPAAHDWENWQLVYAWAAQNFLFK